MDIDREAAAVVVDLANEPQTMAEYVADIKAKTFNSYSWDTMLIAAPVCLELLGSCEMVASSEWASEVELEKPTHGNFIFFKQPRLNGALAEINNQGRTAFIHAREKMSEIHEATKVVKILVGTVVQALVQPKPSMSLIETELGTMLETAEDCQKAAESMYMSFGTWLFSVKELHETCVTTQSSSEASFRRYKDKAEAVKVLETEMASSLKMAEQRQTKMEKYMDEDRTTFQTMLKEAPKGNDLLNQHMALIGAETASNLVNTLGVAGACYISPASSIALGAREFNKGKKDLDELGEGAESSQQRLKRLNDQYEDITDVALERGDKVQTYFAALKHIVDGDSKQGVIWALVLSMDSLAHKPSKKPSTKPAGKSTKVPSGKPVLDRKPKAFKLEDKKPGGSLLDKIRAGMKNGGGKKPAADEGKIDSEDDDDGEESGEEPSIDSGDESGEEDPIGDDSGSEPESGDEPIQGSDDESGDEDEKGNKKPRSKFNLAMVDLLLSREVTTIKKQADDSTKSAKELLKTIASAQKTVKELQAEAKKAKGLKDWKQPSKSSSTVKGWVKNVNSCITSVTKLTAKSKRRAGTNTGRSPILFHTNTAAKENVKARTDLAAATIENSRNQLELQLSTYKSSQGDYMKSADRVLDIQEKLATIRREISEYGQQQTKLSEVRDLLRSCIAFLIDLREQIEILIRFFHTISTLVRLAVTKQVKPFGIHVKNAAKELEDTKMFDQYLLNVIYKYAITIAANFDLYKDISIMYMQIHDKHFVEGLSLVDEMSQIRGSRKQNPTEKDNEEMSKLLEEKKKSLKDYAQSAQTGIKSIVKTTSDGINSKLNDRINKIDDALKSLELIGPNAEIRAAIEDGSKEVEDAISKRTSIKSPAMDYLARPRNERVEMVKADPSLFEY
ncbi:hypothetical protein PT974_10376 [Cladobotryum mycophilum]|uniref:Uncharacterized protein n=1 Tax=Cladobotryum mycophilum TaxID=491253 RepID=A0ABR0SA80_9HYPO